jgi:hypothetical protein
VLIADYNSNVIAISSAIHLITMLQLDSLYTAGRINVLVYLRNTSISAWRKALTAKASAAQSEIRDRASKGKTFIGPQTEDALAKIETRLKINF